MYSTKEKVALGIAGLEIIGCFAVAIYCWGQKKYYEGRISKYTEVKLIIDEQSKLIKDLMEERKERL